MLKANSTLERKQFFIPLTKTTRDKDSLYVGVLSLSFYYHIVIKVYTFT